MTNLLSFRIGTTSYIIEDDLGKNAAYLSSLVGEMEMVLFELESGLSNLPDESMQASLQQVGAETGMVYTVHLPNDLTMRDGGRSVALGEKVLAKTRSLPVYGVVAHIDGWFWEAHDSPKADETMYNAWLHEGRQLVQWLKAEVPEDWAVCIENTEGFPADEVSSLVNGLQVSRCIDVGHLLKEDYPDPLGYVKEHLSECSVIHLHGLDSSGKDHLSVSLLPEALLDSLLTVLVENEYDGILTLEVFGMADFETSIQAIRQSLTRIGVTWEH